MAASPGAFLGLPRGRSIILLYTQEIFGASLLPPLLFVCTINRDIESQPDFHQNATLNLPQRIPGRGDVAPQRDQLAHQLHLPAELE